LREGEVIDDERDAEPLVGLDGGGGDVGCAVADRRAANTGRTRDAEGGVGDAVVVLAVFDERDALLVAGGGEGRVLR